MQQIKPVGILAQDLSRGCYQTDNEGCSLWRCDWSWKIHFQAHSCRFWYKFYFLTMWTSPQGFSWHDLPRARVPREKRNNDLLSFLICSSSHIPSIASILVYSLEVVTKPSWHSVRRYYTRMKVPGDGDHCRLSWELAATSPMISVT